MADHNLEMAGSKAFLLLFHQTNATKIMSLIMNPVNYS